MKLEERDQIDLEKLKAYNHAKRMISIYLSIGAFGLLVLLYAIILIASMI